MAYGPCAHTFTEHELLHSCLDSLDLQWELYPTFVKDTFTASVIIIQLLSSYGNHHVLDFMWVTMYLMGGGGELYYALPGIPYVLFLALP